MGGVGAGELQSGEAVRVGEGVEGASDKVGIGRSRVLDDEGREGRERRGTL